VAFNERSLGLGLKMTRREPEACAFKFDFQFVFNSILSAILSFDFTYPLTYRA